MLSTSRAIDFGDEVQSRQRKIRRAMLFGGFSSFAMLYCVQPMMPLLANQFQLSAAQSSWILSISTICLAISLLICSMLSESIGRVPMMVVAVTTASVATLLCSQAQNYFQLLVLRGFLGLALGGMPAVAIAYLREEIASTELASTIGLYIAGSAFGGMAGRLINALLCDVVTWDVAFAIMGCVGLYGAWEFWRNLPKSSQTSQHQGLKQFTMRTLTMGLRRHLTHRPLIYIFVLGFILTGCFTSFYNYISFRLVAAPFHFSQASLGAISVFYLFGMASSIWVGTLTKRYGRYPLLLLALSIMLCGVVLSLSDQIILLVLGTAIFTLGFFAAHSIASSTIAHLAQSPIALASALYLFFYYAGASILGSVGGGLWPYFAWNGIAVFQIILLILGLLIARSLHDLHKFA